MSIGLFCLNSIVILLLPPQNSPEPGCVILSVTPVSETIFAKSEPFDINVIVSFRLIRRLDNPLVPSSSVFINEASAASNCMRHLSIPRTSRYRLQGRMSSIFATFLQIGQLRLFDNHSSKQELQNSCPHLSRCTASLNTSRQMGQISLFRRGSSNSLFVMDGYGKFN